MPDFFSMTGVLAIFYVVFSSQIFLLSIYYPSKISGRVDHMLRNFPPAEYPKLYPAYHPGYVENEQLKMRLYKAVNHIIALIGMVTLLAMLWSDYRPAAVGGDEIFVLLYFFLQAIPLLYISWKEHNQYRLMRRTFADKQRVAELTRRRLVDFISPIYIAVAVLLYIGWLAFYIGGIDALGGWQVENYATLAVITGLNLAYALTIARHVSGKKQDPYKAPKDQLKQTEAVVKVMVFSSIMASIFLTLIQAADQYSFEVLDPVMTSFYMQLCVVFGLGLMIRMQDLEAIDFEVYRTQDSAAAEQTNELPV